jgi:hypothetical protein
MVQQNSKETKLVLVKAAQSSAGTAVVSDVVDMSGFEGVMFFGSIATANAGNFATVQTGVVSGTVATDVAGSKNVPGTNGHSFLIDIFKPRKRYLKVTVTRAGADTATGDIYALLYGPRIHPVASQGSTIAAESHVSPADGTA